MASNRASRWSNRASIRSNRASTPSKRRSTLRTRSSRRSSVQVARARSMLYREDTPTRATARTLDVTTPTHRIAGDGGNARGNSALGAARRAAARLQDGGLHGGARLLHVRRAVALVGRGPGRLLGLDLGRVRRRPAPGARAGPGRDAGRGLVPRGEAELRRVPARDGTAGGNRHRQRLRVAAARLDVLGRAARPGGSLRGGPAAARRGAWRPRGCLHAERAGDGGGVPRV